MEPRWQKFPRQSRKLMFFGLALMKDKYCGNQRNPESVCSQVFLYESIPICWIQFVVPIEAIKEIRSGSDARYYREQFRLAQEYEDRWLTIVYILDGNYKTLHVISPTKDVFRMWDVTLRKLYAIRQTLMSGLGNFEMRQAIWEKQYWKGADQRPDQKLDFDEVEKMCRRLNINSSTESLLRLFKVISFMNSRKPLSLNGLPSNSKRIPKTGIFWISLTFGILSKC